MRFAILSVVLLLSTSLSVAEKIELKPPKRVPEPESEVIPGEAELALSNFVVPEGFEVSLFAAEPLLLNPVAFTHDEQGRIFVSETHRASSSVLDTRHYPAMLERDLASRTIEDRLQMMRDLFQEPEKFAIESELIRKLEDTDGDGKADKSSVFATGFNTELDGIASGVIARKGKLWFTNIPSLWQLSGADTQDEATSRKELLRGFGIHFGFYGHDLHGLVWGPDGKLYFSIGDRGANVVSQEGERIFEPDRGAVFRCNPDGSEFEVFATGLRNPQELIFDEFGNLFTGDNDCDNGDLERLVHIVEGGDSGWSVGHQYSPLGKAGMWMLESLWKPRHEGQPAYIIPPICNIEDGPSGVAYYPGTGLSPEYQGHIFICHFKGSLARSGVHTYTIKPKGATFDIVDSKPFLQRALPTDVGFGPDGKLYFSDWVTGWRKPKKGRIFAISHPDSDDSKIVRETQRLISEGMEGRDLPELAALLGHPDQRVRLEAQFELADRGNESIDTLAEVAKDKGTETLARVHAVWGLGQIARSHRQAIQPLQPLLNDPEGEIRAQSAKLMGDLDVSSQSKTLVELLQDKEPRVRFFAAQSLGKVGRPSAAKSLIELLRRNDDADHYLRHAAVMGLVGRANINTLKKAATDSSRAVRMGILLAMRRLEAAEIATFLTDEDPDIVAEAIRAINDLPITDAMPQLADLIDQPIASDPISGLRIINAQFRLGGQKNAKALIDYSLDEGRPEKLRAEALHLLSTWPNPFQRDRIAGTYRPLKPRDAETVVALLRGQVDRFLSSNSDIVQETAIKAVGKLSIKDSSDDLYHYVGNESISTGSRIAAMVTLDSLGDPRLAELAMTASQSTQEELRLAALPILAKLSPEQAAPALREIIETGANAELQAAYKALGQLRGSVGDELIVENLIRLEKGEVPPAAQLELLESAEERDSETVKAVLKDREERLSAAANPNEAYTFALEGGRSRQGQDVFNDNAIMACVRCHKVNGSGGDAGPDLTTIAKLHDREYLLESIVNPNAALAHGFEIVIVTTANGETIVGVLQKESEAVLTLQLADGSEKEIAIDSIASRTRAPSSMPDIYKNTFSRAELRDLVEYLSTLTEVEKSDAPRATHGGEI